MTPPEVTEIPAPTSTRPSFDVVAAVIAATAAEAVLAVLCADVAVPEAVLAVLCAEVTADVIEASAVWARVCSVAADPAAS